MTEPRILDFATAKIASYYKVFDSRKRDLSDTVIQNFDLNTTYMFVEARAVKNLTIRNNKVRLKRPQTGGNIPFGVILRSGEDCLVEGNVFENFQMEYKAGAYTNGDGACEERGAKRTHWLNNVFRNNSDGGLDTKGADSLIQGNLSEGNKRNFRLWGNGTLIGNISRDPRGAHIWLNLAGSAAGNYDIKDQQFFDDGLAGAHLQIDGGKPGLVITLTDPVVNGVKVADLSELRIKKSGTGKLVDVKLVVTPAANTVVSLTELRDGDHNGKITLSNDWADRLNLPHGTVLLAPGEKVATGWRYTIK